MRKLAAVAALFAIWFLAWFFFAPDPQPDRQPAVAPQEAPESAPQQQRDDAPPDAAADPPGAPTSDEPPSLVWPVDCSLGSDCWIARYVDRGPGGAVTDYACGARTENEHRGTDITLADLPQMRLGVAVLAAASGTVAGRRDGMADNATASAEQRDQLNGRECGNGVVVRHGNGWETQYCHMAQGSIKHQQGDTVTAGEELGRVGLSGLTEYPHLHIVLRYRPSEGQARIIDPFDGGTYEQGCVGPGDEAGYWQEPVPYQTVALLPPRLVPEKLTRKTMWQGQASTLRSDSPALLIQARVFHTRKGDVMRYTLVAPDGRARLRRDLTLDRGYQVARPFVGVRRPNGGFAAGTWRGTVELVRDGVSVSAASIETRIE